MGMKIDIVKREPEISLALTVRATLWQMQPGIRTAIARILACARAQKVVPTGAPYVRYLGFDWHELSQEGRFAAFIKSFTRQWTLEVGIPMGSAAHPEGEIFSSEVPGGEFVQALHVGPYKNVGDTYSTLLEWVKDRKLEVKAESLEIYLDDPASVKAHEMRTLVLVRLEDVEELI